MCLEHAGMNVRNATSRCFLREQQDDVDSGAGPPRPVHPFVICETQQKGKRWVIGEGVTPPVRATSARRARSHPSVEGVSAVHELD